MGQIFDFVEGIEKEVENVKAERERREAAERRAAEAFLRRKKGKGLLQSKTPLIPWVFPYACVHILVYL